MVDAVIPDAAALFGRLGSVRTFDGRALDGAELANADVLVVRSVTRVDERLLGDSSVRFVGTATSGVDHVDVGWLRRRGIEFAASEGCNSRPVAEYVLTAILLLARRRGFDPRRQTLGVVGVGRIGSLVAEWAEALGMVVLRYDPPLQREHGGDEWVDREELLARSDIVTLHVPLTGEGPNATEGMVERAWLSSMRSDAVLINTSRGEVVDERVLSAALEDKAVGGAILDVWRNEPVVDARLAALVDIATPHVAGYSVEAKRRGAAMVYGAAGRWMGAGIDTDIENDVRRFLAADAPEVVRRVGRPTQAGKSSSMGGLPEVLSRSFDVAAIDGAFRSALISGGSGEAFDALRASISTRREFGAFEVEMADWTLEESAFLATTGFRISE